MTPSVPGQEGGGAPIRSGETLTMTSEFECTEEWLFEHFGVRDPRLCDPDSLIAALRATRLKEPA